MTYSEDEFLEVAFEVERVSRLLGVNHPLTNSTKRPSPYISNWWSTHKHGSLSKSKVDSMTSFWSDLNLGSKSLCYSYHYLVHLFGDPTGSRLFCRLPRDFHSSSTPDFQPFSNVNTKLYIHTLFYLVIYAPLWLVSFDVDTKTLNLSTIKDETEKDKIKRLEKLQNDHVILQPEFREHCTGFYYNFPTVSSDKQFPKIHPLYLEKVILPKLLETKFISKNQYDIYLLAIQMGKKWRMKTPNSIIGTADIGYNLHQVYLEEDDTTNAIKAFMLLTDSQSVLDSDGYLVALSPFLTQISKSLQDSRPSLMAPIIRPSITEYTFQFREQYLAKDVILSAFNDLYLRRSFRVQQLTRSSSRGRGRGKQLTDEQNQILQSVQNFPITLIIGGPGVGKSFMIHYLSTKFRAKVLAYTGCVVSHLKYEGDIPQTITISRAYQHLSETQVTDTTDIVIIDEAAMLNNNLLAMALKIHEAGQQRLVLVADVDQIGPMGLGSPVNCLLRYAEKEKASNSSHPPLTSICRLTKNFRSGGSLDLLRLIQLYKTSSIREDSFTHSEQVKIVKIVDPQKDGQKDLTEIITKLINPENNKLASNIDAMLLTFTNKMVDNLNYIINATNNPDLAVQRFYIGQRIMISLANVPELQPLKRVDLLPTTYNPRDLDEGVVRVYNGERYYISDMRTLTILSYSIQQLLVHCAKKKQYRILTIMEPEVNIKTSVDMLFQVSGWGKYNSQTVALIPVFLMTNKQIGDGWAMTVNKAQGSEFSHVYFVLDGEQYFTPNHGLVALSRAKETMTIFTPSIERLNRLAMPNPAHQEKLQSNFYDLLDGGSVWSKNWQWQPPPPLLSLTREEEEEEEEEQGE